MRDNVYTLDLPNEKYGVHATFNFVDLSSFEGKKEDFIPRMEAFEDEKDDM